MKRLVFLGDLGSRIGRNTHCKMTTIEKRPLTGHHLHVFIEFCWLGIRAKFESLQLIDFRQSTWTWSTVLRLLVLIYYWWSEWGQRSLRFIRIKKTYCCIFPEHFISGETRDKFTILITWFISRYTASKRNCLSILQNNPNKQVWCNIENLH